MRTSSIQLFAIAVASIGCIAISELAANATLLHLARSSGVWSLDSDDVAQYAIVLLMLGGVWIAVTLMGWRLTRDSERVAGSWGLGIALGGLVAIVRALSLYAVPEGPMTTHAEVARVIAILAAVLSGFIPIFLGQHYRKLENK